MPTLIRIIIAVAVLGVATGSHAEAQTPVVDALRTRAQQGDIDAQASLGCMYDLPALTGVAPCG